jgi:hypothetical protein
LRSVCLKKDLVRWSKMAFDQSIEKLEIYWFQGSKTTLCEQCCAWSRIAASSRGAAADKNLTWQQKLGCDALRAPINGRRSIDVMQS